MIPSRAGAVKAGRIPSGDVVPVASSGFSERACLWALGYASPTVVYALARLSILCDDSAVRGSRLPDHGAKLRCRAGWTSGRNLGGTSYGELLCILIALRSGSLSKIHLRSQRHVRVVGIMFSFRLCMIILGGWLAACFILRCMLSSALFVYT